MITTIIERLIETVQSQCENQASSLQKRNTVYSLTIQQYSEKTFKYTSSNLQTPSNISKSEIKYYTQNNQQVRQD